jgi:hypothetical protein
VAKTLPYYITVTITAVKGFRVHAPCVYVKGNLDISTLGQHVIDTSAEKQQS